MASKKNGMTFKKSGSRNVRVDPGVYLAIKHYSELMSVSMGTIVTLFIGMFFATNTDFINNLPSNIQTAVTTDILTSFGDLLKEIGLAQIKNTSLSELYQNLLNPNEERRD